MPLGPFLAFQKIYSSLMLPAAAVNCFSKEKHINTPYENVTFSTKVSILMLAIWILQTSASKILSKRLEEVTVRKLNAKFYFLTYHDCI